MKSITSGEHLGNAIVCSSLLRALLLRHLAQIRPVEYSRRAESMTRLDAEKRNKIEGLTKQFNDLLAKKNMNDLGGEDSGSK